MATPNLSEIVTTTLLSRSKQIADNVTENNALLAKLQMKGRAKPISGGREIVRELSHSENQTYKRYSGLEKLNIAPSEVLSCGGLSVETGSRGGHNQWTRGTSKLRAREDD